MVGPVSTIQTMPNSDLLYATKCIRETKVETLDSEIYSQLPIDGLDPFSSDTTRKTSYLLCRLFSFNE